MSNPLWEYFQTNQDRKAIHKWHHHFEILHQHLNPYKERELKEANPLVIVEIGVGNGGSLQMWRHYFGPTAQIYGIDIDKTKANVDDIWLPKKMIDDVEVYCRFPIFIGDQGNPQFLNYVAKRIGKPIDILIDDGGHTMQQQKCSLMTLFPLMNANSIYVCESTSTSFMPNTIYQQPNEITFMQWIQSDFMNALHLGTESRTPEQEKVYESVKGVHVYPNIIVMERKSKLHPYAHSMIGK
jgi:hypothetical protein